MQAYRLLLLPLILLLFTSCSVDRENTYNLTISAAPEEGGTVSDLGGDYEEGTIVEISASPNDNWLFVGWEGDHTGNERSVQVVMDSDKDIAALFEKRNYPLNIEKVGQGEVFEEVIAQKTTDYPYGTVVELTAEPDDGWHFVGWTGDLSGDENPEQITIDSEKNITAVFEPITFTLTVETEGEGGVLKELEQTKTTEYNQGDRVKLTAEPEEGWLFAGWEGDLDGSDNPAVITMDSDKSVTAVFLRFFSLTTSVNPSEGGSIEPESGQFVRDSIIEVEAIPASSGWEFDRWEGDFSGSENPFNLTMNGEKTLVAFFKRKEFTFEVNVEGQGNVDTVLLSGVETAGRFLYESEVELTASPADGWNFAGWKGDLATTDNPVVITIDDNKSVTAVFSQFEGGEGTEANPYQVANVTQLQQVGSHLDSYFIQVNPIDANETNTWNDGLGFEPLGDDTAPFTGQYDGDEFEISGLTINRPGKNHTGLFGVVSNGLIKNLSLANVSVTGNQHVGGVTGLNEGDLEGVTVTGTVNGHSMVGGFTGTNSGQITDSYSMADVEGESSVGGFSGSNTADGNMTAVYATGLVIGNGQTGGLTGINNGSILSGYWDTETTNQADGTGEGDSNGMDGLTTDQMTGSDASDTMDGFDFINIWKTVENNYPVLRWQE